MRSLETEEDIEQLRKIALLQQKQLELLTRVLAEKSATIDELSGRGGDLQETLDLLNAKNGVASGGSPRKVKAKRGSTRKEKPAKLSELPRETKLFELDEPDRTCPACGGILEPMAGQAAFEALHQRLLAEQVIGLDQTAWPNLDAKAKKPWQMWCFTAEGMVTYQICRDKSAETMKQLLGSRLRTVVCDMLSTHGKAARDGPHLTLAACWAHAFRPFREAAEDHVEAEQMMALIGRLYDIDAEARTLEEKAALRSTKSRLVCTELRERLLGLAVPKVTSLGEASRYVLRFWECFTRFLDDPRIPFDNNETERGIRGPVVGRKNTTARSQGPVPRSQRSITHSSRGRNSRASSLPATSSTLPGPPP
ncbi:MAG: IS66 family transposase [Myxococcota bacterium]